MQKSILEYNLMRKKVSNKNSFEIEAEEKLGRNDDCWCGSGKKYKKCHCSFDEKLDEYRHKCILVPPRRIIKNPVQVQGIRESAKINIEILNYIDEHIQAGISTQEIDNWVCTITKKYNAIAATLNYEGYPKSVCTSINNVVCHGIPSKNEILKDGDIVNVDVSTKYKGYFSDSSRMYCIGNVSGGDYQTKSGNWSAIYSAVEKNRGYGCCDSRVCSAEWLFCGAGDWRTWCRS